MPLPPRWVRRCLLAPGVVLAAVLLVTTIPLWLLLALAVTATVPGFLRIPRVLWLATFYLVWDSAALVCLAGLWVGSGFGWKLRSPSFVRAHYVLAAAFMRLLFRQARWVLRLRIEFEGDEPADAGPVILASRHGGPGDSLILVHLLLNHSGREPRIVLKDTLQWDPAIDVLLNRVPTRFIAPSPFHDPVPRTPDAGVAAQVGRLAAGMDTDDVLVIFPEGGQFTSRRRLARISRLRDDGRAAMAARAEAMRHVMAPRPGGLLAAMEAAPHASVLFVAHTGLERLRTIGDMWRELPMDKRITIRGWSVPPQDVPEGRDARVDWLYGWWERLDRWIAARQGDA